MQTVRVTYYAGDELLDPLGVTQTVGTVPRVGDRRIFDDPLGAPASYRSEVWEVTAVEWSDTGVLVYLVRAGGSGEVDRFDRLASRATDAVVAVLTEWGEDALPPEPGSEDAAVLWWAVRDALAPAGAPGHRAAPDDGEAADRA